MSGLNGCKGHAGGFVSQMLNVPVQQVIFFCQAEDGIRDLVRSRGLGDVYKRQIFNTLGIQSFIEFPP